MAQTYTLEEAADKLDLAVEEFKRRLRGEWSQVRSFRDGATLRFRANEIDELARSIGLGSSEELPMADSGYDLPSPASAGHSPAATPPTKSDSDAPLKLDDSDETFLITPDQPGKSPSSKKLTGKSDSDVRLEKSSKRPAAADDEESILTEELEAGPSASGKLSGKSGKLSAAKLKSDSGKIKAGDSAKPKAATPPKAMEDSSSEFELSLEADSDEFELSLAPDSSEEVALGEAPAAPSAKSGQSGINLNRPADSGVSLEKRKQPATDDEIDFELSLETPGSGASGKKASSGKLRAGKKADADSDSEFELTLEEPSDLSLEATSEAAADKKGDIFEATDFEIPALEDDSASEAVSLEESDTDLESSDFDLALDEADAVADDESASEVVALDDEEAGSKRGKKRKRRAVEDDEDEGDVDLGEDLDEDEDFGERSAREDEEEREVVIATPAKWGPLPAILMAPTVLLMFIGGLMAYETLHSVWGYQQTTKPTTPLISWFADTFGMKPGS